MDFISLISFSEILLYKIKNISFSISIDCWNFICSFSEKYSWIISNTFSYWIIRLNLKLFDWIFKNTFKYKWTKLLYIIKSLIYIFKILITLSFSISLYRLLSLLFFKRSSITFFTYKYLYLRALGNSSKYFKYLSFFFIKNKLLMLNFSFTILFL